MSGNISWSEEWPKIQAEALRYGVDPFFIRAIRAAEAGGEGRQFGVLSVPAPTYDDQLRVCCASVQHRVYEWNVEWRKADDFDPLFERHILRDGSLRLAYTDEFINWFASIWAPSGVTNDPHNLNSNWARNVKALYRQAMEDVA